MRCGKCQREIPTNAKFCNKCGWEVKEINPMPEIVLKCSVCNTAITPGAFFCPSCGASTDSSTPSVPVLRETVIVEKSQKTNLLVIILSIALVFALVLGGVATYFALKEPARVPEQAKTSENTKTSSDDESYTTDQEDNSSDTDNYDEQNAVTTNPSNSTEDDTFLFPSDKRYITYEDLYGLSKYEVALIRNEIFARHGHIFQTQEYIDYFSTKAWYVPYKQVTDADLNSYEIANKDFIVQYEKELGWR